MSSPMVTLVFLIRMILCMKRTLMLSALSVLLLTGCAQSQATVQQVIDTASGTINEGVNRAKSAAQPIVDAAKDAQKRAEDIKKGIEKMQEGKEEIQKALAH